jgi:hypothetical protein
MFTCMMWCYFHRTNGDAYTNSVILCSHACRNHSFVWFSHAYCDEHTHECNFWTQSVISTRTSVIYIRRVWFLYPLKNTKKYWRKCLICATTIFTWSVIFTQFTLYWNYILMCLNLHYVIDHTPVFVPTSSDTRRYVSIVHSIRNFNDILFI